ncbi:hypothetical protein G3480_25540 [Thiorhodococcus mannitoliphagus]|uniref:Uncharacterized protein n=1 Tax=Thiorhodococcus mannitoliphagus TaxID=329406 RepID=A0A6P1DZE0_9GAMM|nr:hypothetical protein [Thiorhodococcus mannitoliphagus]NEX23598.1 hypothetical protein [Thiorhodococcus mannitoliphagus]
MFDATLDIPNLADVDVSSWREVAMFDGNTETATEPLRLDITIFPDRHAKTKRQRNVAWSEVGEIIASEPAKRDKGQCPAIKLMTFGDATSDAGCLRTNDNALQISGREGDYDYNDDDAVELVTHEEGISRLDAAGVRGLVYTTWSHTSHALGSFF